MIKDYYFGSEPIKEKDKTLIQHLKFYQQSRNLVK